jgi:hypothetical protein
MKNHPINKKLKKYSNHCDFQAFGRKTEKVVPSSILVVKEIFPPVISIMFLEIASPSHSVDLV